MNWCILHIWRDWLRFCNAFIVCVSVYTKYYIQKTVQISIPQFWKCLLARHITYCSRKCKPLTISCSHLSANSHPGQLTLTSTVYFVVSWILFILFRAFCDSRTSCERCLKRDEFGKVVKSVFPDVKSRRLGEKSKSVYPSFNKHIDVFCSRRLWLFVFISRPWFFFMNFWAVSWFRWTSKFCCTRV